jgi:hypothetical protein
VREALAYIHELCQYARQAREDLGKTRDGHSQGRHNFIGEEVFGQSLHKTRTASVGIDIHFLSSLSRCCGDTFVGQGCEDSTPVRGASYEPPALF